MQNSPWTLFPGSFWTDSGGGWVVVKQALPNYYPEKDWEAIYYQCSAFVGRNTGYQTASSEKVIMKLNIEMKFGDIIGL